WWWRGEGGGGAIDRALISFCHYRQKTWICRSSALPLGWPLCSRCMTRERSDHGTPAPVRYPAWQASSASRSSGVAKPPGPWKVMKFSSRRARRSRSSPALASDHCVTLVCPAEVGVILRTATPMVSRMIRLGKITTLRSIRPISSARSGPCLRTSPCVRGLDPRAVLLPQRGRPAGHRPRPRTAEPDRRVPVTEIEGLVETAEVRPAALDLLQVLKVGGVHRQQVVAVDAVLHEQLPVAVRRVLLRPGAISIASAWAATRPRESAAPAR